MDKLNPKTKRKVVDGLGRSVRQFHYNAAENILEHEDDLVHESSYDVKPKEPKLGSREHKLKFPERYVSTYTSNLTQAAFPIPGTAPEEIAAAKKIVNENGPVKNGEPDKPKINTFTEIPIPTINYSLLRDPKQEARDAAIEKLRVHAFTKSESDEDKGIGSLANTTGRKLRAAAAKDSWTKNREKIYEK